MAYRDILLHLKPSLSGSDHLDAAVRLAASHKARLTAVMTFRDVAVLKLLYSEASPIVQERLQEVERTVSEMRGRFFDLAGMHGVPARFDVAEGEAAELLEMAGRFHDLVVVSQTDPEAEEVGPDICEHAAMTTGRPLLVLPRKGGLPTIGHHVLVGWNASREAALAVQHAQPFLASAARITIVNGSPRETHPTVTRCPPLDIADHLRRFCPTVEVMPLTAVDAQAGAGILAMASQVAADLVVMGAYGRSRMREWLMGGATHHVLRHAKVPLLLAH